MSRALKYYSPAQRQAAYRDRKRNAVVSNDWNRWRAAYGPATLSRLIDIDQQWGHATARAAAEACEEALAYAGVPTGALESEGA